MSLAPGLRILRPKALSPRGILQEDMMPLSRETHSKWEGLGFLFPCRGLKHIKGELLGRKFLGPEIGYRKGLELGRL